MYKLNIETAEMELIYENDRFVSFVFDNNMLIRLGATIDEKGNTVLWNPKQRGNFSDWELYRTIPFLETSSPSSFDATDENLYWTESENRDLGKFGIILKCTPTLFYHVQRH